MVDGLATTGRVITSAALIMVCVFTSFILNGDPVVKQFGVGLAVGGGHRRDDRALPARAGGDGAARAGGVVVAGLARRGSCRSSAIEGEEYFDERDAEAARASGEGAPA